ncbi:MAG: hypothetical protein HC857_08815 [Synechococcales cyanobacterium RU_4_20]|nr:hypothetical protein [Synechococcales cyanobacterium RU_4_20]
MSSVFETAQTPVKFAIANDWGSGFTGTLTFKNPTAQPLNGWRFEFTTPFKLRQLWAGQIIQETRIDTPNGPTYRYVVRHASWTSNVPVNGSVEIGFNVDIPSGRRGSPRGFVWMASPSARLRRLRRLCPCQRLCLPRRLCLLRFPLRPRFPL